MKTRVAAALAAIAVLAGCSSPSPSPPTVVTSLTPAPTAPAAKPPTLNGTLFFLGIGDTHGGLYALTGGHLSTAVDDHSFAFYQSAAVSPDGHRVAFVDGAEAGSLGPMRIITLGGPTSTKGPATISNLFVPQWTPDGMSIHVAYGGVHFGLLNVSTGAISPASGPDLALYSPDGGYAVALGAGPAYTVTKADGSGSTPVVVPAGKAITRIQSLSPDGRRIVCLLRDTGEPEGDAGRTLAANSIVDTRTGAIIPAPGGGTLRQMYYLADGSSVARTETGGVKQIKLIGADGHILDTITETAATADLALLAYIPGPA